MKLFHFFKSSTPLRLRRDLSLLRRNLQLKLETDPYPYVLVENALDESLYSELENLFPSEEHIRKGKKVANRDQLMARDILTNDSYPLIWREFVHYHTSRDFYLELLRLFAPWVRKSYPWLEQDLGRSLEDLSVGLRDPEAASLPDCCLDCQPGLNTVSLSPTTPRTAHLDANNKLFTGLFYMKPDIDNSQGGDFLIHRLKTGSPRFLSDTTVHQDDLEVARVIPYRKNTAVFFMNSPLSLHGVSVRDGTPIPRRLVNIVGGLYTLRRKELFPSPPIDSIRSCFDISVPDIT